MQIIILSLLLAFGFVKYSINSTTKKMKEIGGLLGKTDISVKKSSFMSFRMGILILIILVTTGFSYRMFWWTITPGGDIDEDNTGTTVGQAAIGLVYGVETRETGSYGFWYQGFEPIVCFNISRDFWDVDTVEILTTTGMDLGEQINITNCGNCHLNFGLKFIASDPLPWTWGYSAGPSKFVLRAQFTDADIPPIGFDATHDYINDIVTWATSETFGDLGFGFPISGSLLNLWLQLYSPGSSSVYNDVNTITILIQAQANLP